MIESAPVHTGAREQREKHKQANHVCPDPGRVIAHRKMDSSWALDAQQTYVAVPKKIFVWSSTRDDVISQSTSRVHRWYNGVAGLSLPPASSKAHLLSAARCVFSILFLILHPSASLVAFIIIFLRSSRERNGLSRPYGAVSLEQPGQDSTLSQGQCRALLSGSYFQIKV